MIQQAIAMSLYDNHGNKENQINNNNNNIYEDDNDIDMQDKDINESNNNNNNIQPLKKIEIEIEDEPDEKDIDATQIRIRLPDGTILQRRFRKQTLIEQLYKWISKETNKSLEQIQLIQPMPRMKIESNQMNKSLKDLGLLRATLNCSFE